MSDYGLFLESLPMFLGEERLMVFQRKIRRSEIQNPIDQGTGSLRTLFTEIYLGPPEDVFAVFADYLAESDYYAGWHGGGLRSPELPLISDQCFASCLTDNQLVLRPDGWYLVAFRPNHDATPWATDFYVYRLAKQPAESDRYGLNIYGRDGSLRYHSGWDILRAVEFRMPSLRGDNGLIGVCATSEQAPPDLYLHDWQAEYGRRVFVGGDKLVSIGFASVSENINEPSYRLRGRYWYAPYLKDGWLGWSLAHARFGVNFPHNTYGMGHTMYAGDETVLTPPLLIYKPAV